MRLYFLMSLLPCIAFGAERSVSPVGFSESKEGVPAFSPSGAVTLPAVSLRLDVIHLDGKKERCYLTVVYDPQNGYYFARYAPPNAPGDDTDYVIKALRSQMATVYADATGLYAFEFPNTIWLRVATSRADSIEAAERAYIHEMEQGGPN